MKLVQIGAGRLNEVDDSDLRPAVDIDAVHATMIGPSTSRGVARQQSANPAALPGQAGFDRKPPCQHLGKLTGEVGPCTSCGDKGTPVPLHACLYVEDGFKPHSVCSIDRPVHGAMCCQHCPHHVARVKRSIPMPLPKEQLNGSVEASPGQYGAREVIWQYGVMTVPERRWITLPRTLASLADGGFDSPHLFVDGCSATSDREAYATFDKVTFHSVNVLAYGNWLLALMELYILNPRAHRYVIFQDDLVCCKNLRAYLDRLTCPTEGYWNLYCAPENERIAEGRIGFMESDQFGKGALALVFDGEALRQLWRQGSIFDKPADPNRGHKNIDGAVVQALSGKHNKSLPNWREWVHHPSLVQHTGDETTIMQVRENDIPNAKLPKSATFVGEDYDALSMLKKA